MFHFRQMKALSCFLAILSSTSPSLSGRNRDRGQRIR